ncbi:MAG: carboxypeptidase regulatory-like domain-containing protein [Spirochaetota bacterium]
MKRTLLFLTVLLLLMGCNSNSNSSNDAIRLLALQQPDSTVQPTLSIKGKLTDSSGNAISGATLSTGLSTSLSTRGISSRSSSTTTTDSSGSYNLNLSTGNYTISVTSSTGEDLGDMTYTLNNVTDTPTASVNSTQFSNAITLVITVNSSLPEPASLSFTDTDTTSGSIGGTLTIEKASDESAIQSYALFWADSNQQAISEMAVFDVTGNKIIYIISSGTTITTDAVYLQVRSKNSSGEYSSSGINIAINDSK